MQYRNTVTFKVYGTKALFSEPVTRVGGEKTSYLIPTYEAIKGILSSVYWKPSFIWIIDEVRIMNPIQTQTVGVRTKNYSQGNDLSIYSYLMDVCYQVKAHFEWNRNRPELAQDFNEHKHHNIAKRMIERGGRRDIFLGTRECQGYVEPCTFGEGEGAYDDTKELSFGYMFHGFTYADEAVRECEQGKMSVRFWYPKMVNGILTFSRPEDCPHVRVIKNMQMKQFGEGNFTPVENMEEGKV